MSRPPSMPQGQGCFCCPQSPTIQSSPIGFSPSSNSRQMREEESVFQTDHNNINNTVLRLHLSHAHHKDCIANSISTGNTTTSTDNSTSVPNNGLLQYPWSDDPNCLNSLMQDIHITNQNESMNSSGNDSTSNATSLPLQQQLPQSCEIPSSNIETGITIPAIPFNLNPCGINSISPSVDVRMSFMSLQSRQLGGRFHPHNKSYLSTSAPSVPPSREENENSSRISSLTGTNMDLDIALDELGMLSTVTKSRRDYLLETRGTTSALKRERRLRSKSESSPNLFSASASESLSRFNGLRVVHLDSSYVTGVFSSSNSSSASSLGVRCQSPFPTCDLATLPVRSQSLRMEYRKPDELLEASTLARRRRSVPRMSRFRADRYKRSSRCPYKVPNRLSTSMQEGEFDSIGIQNNGDVFCSSSSLPDRHQCSSSTTSSSTFTPGGGNGHSVICNDNNYNSDDSPFMPSLLSPLLSASSSHQHQSKSNTNSPMKPRQDQPLVRSLSVEDLHSTPARKLALLFDVQDSSMRRAAEEEDEVHFEHIASQFTDLHMC